MSSETEQHLMSLSPEELAALAKNARSVIGNKKFVPSKGAQTDAYYSKADILLFGGEPGGGKTGLIIGLALNEHERSLLVRKQFSDLAGIIDNTKDLAGTTDGFVGGMRPKYDKPDGGVIHFEGMSQDEGIDTSKQGTPHDLICIARGTPVLMAGGFYKAIEEIKTGDCVQTLEGAKKVRGLIPLRRDLGVRVSTYDSDGKVMATQVQSRTHSLLTSEGWVSHDKFSLPRPFSSVESTGYYGPNISSSRSEALCSTLSQPCDSIPGHLAQFHELFGQGLGHQYLQGFSASCEQLIRESDSEAFGDEHQDGQQHALSISQQEPSQFAPPLLSSSFCQPLSGHDAVDALAVSSPQDCQENCLSDTHPYGERFRLLIHRGSVSGGDPAYPLLPSGAAQPIPTDSEAYAPQEIPIHSLRKQWYIHPYTKEKRLKILETIEVSASYAPIGEVDLFDIEVEDANHYITEGGFVNKNCVDEGAQLPEDAIRMLIGWNRTKKKGQRCRMVIATNPPTDAVGDWMVGFFAPWLDPGYPNPAKHGELRWFIINPDGKSEEVESSEPVIIDGEKYFPHSRTFIPAGLEDNPFIDSDDYKKRLQVMPEPYRTILLSGNFMLSRKDDMKQTIPTAWVRAAQSRWTEKPPKGIPMTSMGVDPAQGGGDDTVVSWRHDFWFSPLLVEKGVNTPTGSETAGMIVSKRRDDSQIIVDVGGGYGGAVCLRLNDNGIEPDAFNGAGGSSSRTRDGKLKFFNRRAAAWWKFRELLDPDQEGGSPAMLPPDPQLLADLTAPRFEITARGIQLEDKKQIKKRLNRSPGKGDAIVMCYNEGKVKFGHGLWSGGGSKRGGNLPRVNMGHSLRRRK